MCRKRCCSSLGLKSSGIKCFIITECEYVAVAVLTSHLGATYYHTNDDESSGCSVVINQNFAQKYDFAFSRCSGGPIGRAPIK